jgi:protocatechuate 3,4-dioxygenase beta subunit
MSTRITRRDFAMQTAGGALLAACGGGGAASPDARTGPDAEVGACTVYPQQTEGPYYLDESAVRRDITEDRPGAPLALTITVRDADCAPLAGVAVDVWHCDAAGVYSGYPGQLGGKDTTGQTFLRGTQVTGADGAVTFDTIYPGWYPGRTTHIHVKVHPTAATEATSQLYFPEDVTAAVYATAPYDDHGPKDTSNVDDGVVLQSGLPPLVAIDAAGGGYAASLTITVAS